MKRASLFITSEANEAMDLLIKQNNRLWNKTALASYAINLIVEYYTIYHTLPAIGAKIQPTCQTIELTAQSSDLPGLTSEVIQSHLVRFPKVTPDDYRGIIKELRRRQASEEGLKNPEAAAYGLCKRIQYGQAPQATAAAQEPQQPQPNSVPEDAFAVY